MEAEGGGEESCCGGRYSSSLLGSSRCSSSVRSSILLPVEAGFLGGMPDPRFVRGRNVSGEAIGLASVRVSGLSSPPACGSLKPSSSASFSLCKAMAKLLGPLGVPPGVIAAAEGGAAVADASTASIVSNPAGLLCLPGLMERLGAPLDDELLALPLLAPALPFTGDAVDSSSSVSPLAELPLNMAISANCAVRSRMKSSSAVYDRGLKAEEPPEGYAASSDPPPALVVEMPEAFASFPAPVPAPVI